MNAAFLLSRDAFNMVYGPDSVAEIGRQAHLLSTEPTDLSGAPPDWLDRVDVLFTGWGTPPLTNELLMQMPRLRAVFHGAGSIRSVVTEACWARGIVVCSAAALNALPVIEYTVGAIYLSFKRVFHQDRALRRERTYTPLKGVSSATGYGSTVGLLSLGLIGRGVAQRLAGADFRLIAHDPILPAADFAALGIEPVSLEDLFAQSDVLSLHAPLLPETKHLVNRRLLDRMPPGATFINTARGGLVNEPELIEFLRIREDVQAILDVTEPEPPVISSPLYDLPNVLLTPHIAGSIGPECRRLGRGMADDFTRFLARQPLQYEVTRATAVLRA